MNGVLSLANRSRRNTQSRSRSAGKQLEGVLTRTHGYERPSSVYEQLSSIRMTAAQRREAIIQMQRAEAIADLFVRAAGLLRQAAAGVGRAYESTRASQKEFVDYDKC